MKFTTLLFSAVVAASPFKQQVFSNGDERYLEIFNELKNLDITEAQLLDLQDSWKDLFEQLNKEELEGYFAKFKKFVSVEKQESKSSKSNISKPPKQLLDLIKSDDSNFQILSSEDNNHQLRVKELGHDSLGLDTVKQFVGYLDVRDVDKHFFYWFFESRNDPENDPIILWLNGGPGCASDTGLFFELGPSSINATLQPVYNPYSWNNNASVIFLDQPVGVGYSYAGEEDINTSAKSAKDVYIFLELFFKKFPQFLKNKFHVTGESYAGHYIPAIGSEILDHPERSFELSSVLIGNGAVQKSFQKYYDHKMICGGYSIEPLLSEENCTTMDKYLNKCLKLQLICDYANNYAACIPSSYYCNLAYGPFWDLKLNPYDLRRQCVGGELCYDEMGYMSDYMNLESTKEILGVPLDLEFVDCNNTLLNEFVKSHDRLIPYQKAIGKILDYGIPVLHYAGDKDFQCHWIGFNAVSDTVKYKYQEEFKSLEFQPWIKDGKLIGELRNYDQFTFLRIYDAGHMVPHDQPQVALHMLNTWLSGDYNFGI